MCILRVAMIRPTLLGLLVALLVVPTAHSAAVLPVGAPVEPLLSQVASRIAGAPVTVSCVDDDTAQTSYAYPGEIHLTVNYCWILAEYAQATEKPTMCQATRVAKTVKPMKVRYRKTVRVKRHGHMVTRRVWRTRTVRRTVTSVEQAGMFPCHTAPAGLRLQGPVGRYGVTVNALQTLAHEAVHEADIHAGITPTEHRAQCGALQVLPTVTTMMGGTVEDGAAISAYYATNVQPSRPGEYGLPC